MTTMAGLRYLLFSDPIKEQKSISHLFPQSSPWIIEPTREGSLEAMVSSKLSLKDQFHLLTGSIKQTMTQTLIIKRGTGMRSQCLQPCICVGTKYDHNLCVGSHPSRCACFESKWGMCPNNILTDTRPASRIICPTEGPIRLAVLPR